jgi:hypothetical protein
MDKGRPTREILGGSGNRPFNSSRAQVKPAPLPQTVPRHRCNFENTRLYRFCQTIGADTP